MIVIIIYDSEGRIKHRMGVKYYSIMGHEITAWATERQGPMKFDLEDGQVVEINNIQKEVRLRVEDGKLKWFYTK